jgi:hypothetical protein
MLYSRGEGRYEKEYQELWNRLVPESGQADTVQGELVRVIGRLGSEFDRNGNCNWDRGFRLYTNFLYKYLRDTSVFDEGTIRQIETDIQEIRDFGSHKKDLVYDEGEDAFDRITDRVVEWCQQHPKLIKREVNPKLRR